MLGIQDSDGHWFQTLAPVALSEDTFGPLIGACTFVSRGFAEHIKDGLEDVGYSDLMLSECDPLIEILSDIDLRDLVEEKE